MITSVTQKTQSYRGRTINRPTGGRSSKLVRATAKLRIGGYIET